MLISSPQFGFMFIWCVIKVPKKAREELNFCVFGSTRMSENFPLVSRWCVEIGDYKHMAHAAPMLFSQPGDRKTVLRSETLRSTLWVRRNGKRGKVKMFTRPKSSLSRAIIDKLTRFRCSAKSREPFNLLAPHSNVLDAQFITFWNRRCSFLSHTREAPRSA